MTITTYAPNVNISDVYRGSREKCFMQVYLSSIYVNILLQIRFVICWCEFGGQIKVTSCFATLLLNEWEVLQHANNSHMHDYARNLINVQYM